MNLFLSYYNLYIKYQEFKKFYLIISKWNSIEKNKYIFNNKIDLLKKDNMCVIASY